VYKAMKLNLPRRSKRRLPARVQQPMVIESRANADWCRNNRVTLNYIQPGKPNQNAYIERFNRTFRHEVLDAYVFESLRQVHEITRQWITEYNEERPHDSLGRIPPAVFRRQIENAENSTSGSCH